MREKLGELVLDGLPGEVGESDVDVAAVLPHQLPAGAARSRRLFRLRDDTDRGEAPLARRERREQRDALSADREAIRAVLNVAAAINLASVRHQPRADFEAGKGSDGILPSRPRFVDEVVHGRGEVTTNDRHAHFSRRASSSSTSTHVTPSLTIKASR